MNSSHYLEKLQNSEEFKNFMKRNPDAFLCSGFFVIDKTGSDNKIHFDYFASPPISPTAHPELPSLRSEIDNEKLIKKSFNNSKKSQASEKEQDKIGKIFSFQLEQGIQLVPIEIINDKTPEKLLENCDFDFEEVEKMIVDKMKEQGIKNKIQKILLSLQSKDGKCFLIGTVFVSSLGMLKINIDLTDMNITDFEKKSFFDIIRKVK